MFHFRNDAIRAPRPMCCYRAMDYVGKAEEAKRAAKFEGDVLRALEPVADWYDIHGHEGDKREIREIMDDVVSDLVGDRKQNLAMRSLCRKIVDEAKFSSDGRTGRVSDELIDKLELLLG